MLPSHVAGPGLFTIPHGPVRSGVVESIEYLVETPGEEIPHLNMRIFYKHRGIEQRFEGLPPGDGVLLAERVEGIASVAHALAYCHALEQIAGTAVPRGAALIRTVHAELERLACHLDVALRLADAAGLAVAAARLGWHKERVLRLVGGLCGSRFGRGVVVPGGVAGPALIAPAELLAALADLDRHVTPDLRLLMGTASFLDRLRRTGPLRPGRAGEHGALGPLGRASGITDDTRQARPGDAYEWLPVRWSAGRAGTRWPGSRSASRRSRSPSAWCARRPASSPERTAGRLTSRCGRRATRRTGARRGGPRPRRARSSTTSAWSAGASAAAGPGRPPSTTWS